MRLRSVLLASAALVLGAGGAAYYVYGTGGINIARPVASQAQPGGEGAGQTQAARPQPVMVAKVTQASVPIEFGVIGAVQASETVLVKSRMDGQIVKVHFKDGQDVSAGDLLFTLDSRAIESQLRQLEAVAARDRAQLANTKRDLDRYTALSQNNFVARTTLDQTKTNVTIQESTILADEAQIESQKVLLSYTAIRAPISGRAGSINLTTGNVVRQADLNPMVTLNQIRPVNVQYAVPQKYFGTVREAVNRAPIAVVAEIPGTKDKIPGTIKFYDNVIDSTTGTFQVKATFDNKDGALWPGMFVNVVMRLGEDPNAIVVPSAAVQNGQQGRYVFVVKSDRTVELRVVTVLREGNNQVVIQAGVQPGETVVTDGQSRLVSGTRVEIRNAESGALNQTAARTDTASSEAVKQ